MEGLIKIFRDEDADVFCLKPNGATCLHDNGKIAKLLTLNYVACANLIVESDVSTNYNYFMDDFRIIIRDFNVGFLVITSRSVIFRVKLNGLINFKFMTEESYNRIKDLCTDLVNKYKV